MSRSKNVKKGLVSGIINNLLSLFLPFVTRTIIIYTFSSEYLGLNGLFTSLINVLNITELGFGSALSYILYKPIADKDDEKICEILSFARRVFRIIGIIILVIGLGLLPFLDKLVSGDCPPEMNLYVLYVMYLANSVVSYFMFSYKRLLFSASQRYDIETTIASVTLILQYILQIIVLLVTHNYYLFVLMMILASIANNIVCQVVTKRNYPQYVCNGQLGEADLKVIKKHVKGVFASKIGATVYGSVDNLVISAIFGLALLGKYTNYHYMITSVVAFFAIIHNTLRPILGNYIITETKEKNFNLFLQVTSIYNWLSAFCTCCLLCLFQDFMLLWAGNEYLFPTGYVFLFATMFFIGRLNCMPNVYSEAAGLWNESKWVYLMAAITNLVLNIVLAVIIGLPGIPIATIISSLVVSAGGYIYVLFHHYFTEKSQVGTYIRNVLYGLVMQITVVAIVYYISTIFAATTILLLLLKGVVIIILFALCYLLMSLSDVKQMKNNMALILSMIKK